MINTHLFTPNGYPRTEATANFQEIEAGSTIRVLVRRLAYFTTKIINKQTKSIVFDKFFFFCCGEIWPIVQGKCEILGLLRRACG